jgi:nitrogen regulatory protein P-II 1
MIHYCFCFVKSHQWDAVAHPKECPHECGHGRLKARSTFAARGKTGYRARNAMKKLEAIIQPFKLDEVKEALKAIGIDGMTITEVRGHGRQKGHKEVYRGQEYNVDLLPKVKIELVVAGDRVEEAIKTLTAAARTGKIGDGKLFVYDVAEAIRIRNDDRGDAAL